MSNTRSRTQYITLKLVSLDSVPSNWIKRYNFLLLSPNALSGGHFFFFFFLPYHLFLHCLENRTKPISTPYDGRRWWDSNLRTPTCKSPTLPLCYGWSFCWAHWVKWAIAWSKLRNCAWDPILLDSAPLNYVKKSGSKALLKIAPNSSFLYFPLVYSLFRFL